VGLGDGDRVMKGSGLDVGSGWGDGLVAAGEGLAVTSGSGSGSGATGSGSGSGSGGGGAGSSSAGSGAVTFVRTTSPPSSAGGGPAEASVSSSASGSGAMVTSTGTTVGDGSLLTAVLTAPTETPSSAAAATPPAMRGGGSGHGTWRSFPDSGDNACPRGDSLVSVGCAGAARIPRNQQIRDGRGAPVTEHTPEDPSRPSVQPSAQSQEHPGSDAELAPRADHGEDSYRGTGKLAGRRALITGADSGIGRAVAIAFAREGADVVLSYLAEEEQDARETARLVEEAGRKAVLAPGDIADESHCDELVRRTVAELGGIDLLVNNAAHQMARGGITDISSDQFDRVMKTNVYAMFWLCRAAVPHLPPGSSIINTSSVQAYQPSPELLDYATTKAAIVNFTRGLAQELADKGIRVNTVAPGPIWTPLIPSTMPPDEVEGFGGQTPLGRVGQPAEVAPAFVFLASAEASYITGERLAVTGGSPLP
jgi:NAD(P)-dependent dehydrogenase (short-subunit alcohol dehydrogenase family)